MTSISQFGLYHRGFEAAERGDGVKYLDNVTRLRQQYFTGTVKSPTWRALRCWARELAATGTLESGARPAYLGPVPAP